MLLNSEQLFHLLVLINSCSSGIFHRRWIEAIESYFSLHFYSAFKSTTIRTPLEFNIQTLLMTQVTLMIEKVEHRSTYYEKKSKDFSIMQE